jgi:hypothetical protein
LPGLSTKGGKKAPIRLGVVYLAGFDEAVASIGLGGLTTGDTAKQARAVTDWINEHGGLGGHPIQQFDYDVNDAGPGSGDHVASAACAAMAQDYKVDYVITIFNLHTSPSLLPCLAKHGIGLLDDQTNYEDSTMAKYAGFLANPGEFAVGRRTSIMVDDLWKRGWLTKTSKIGVLAVDGPDGRKVVDGALTQTLARHGLKPESVQYVDPANSGDGGNAASRSAALKFATLGVDRVITVLYSPLYFMIGAESQQYRPWYAVNSDVGPGALLESASPNQVRHAAGIGWLPFYDIGPKTTPPPPVSPRETLCFDIMRKAGQPANSNTVKGTVVLVCNTLFYLKEVADRLPDLPADVLTKGRALIGKSFVSAATYRTDVTRRTDGAAAYRPLAYQDDCACFRYVGPLTNTP